MAKKLEAKAKYYPFVIVAVLGLVLGLIGGFALDAEPDYSDYTLISDYTVLEGNLTNLQSDYETLADDYEDLQETTNFYEDEFDEEIRERAVYDILAEWAEDNFIDELDLDDDDYEDYTFEIDLEKFRYAEFDEDDGDYEIIIEGEIEWDDGDDYGEWACNITGQVEDDDDLDDEEIECDMD